MRKERIMLHLKKFNFMKYICMYMLLISTSGFYFQSKGYACYVPVMISILAIFFYKIRINKNVLCIALVMCVNIILSSIFAGDESVSIFLACIAVVTGFLVTSSIPKEEFVRCYCALMYYLCLFSTLIFCIVLTNQKIITYFPQFIDGTISTYFTGVSFVRLATQWVAMRNQSIFWEPGAFQTFIILAFLFEVSKYGLKKRKYLYCYAMAIITTMSTTGYVVLFLVIIIWLLEENDGKSLKEVRILVSVMICVCSVMIIYSLLPQGTSNKTFDKIVDIINGDIGNNVSVQTRINSIIYSLKSTIQSPIIGVGKTGLMAWKNYSEIGINVMTFTPGNWMGRFGILFGCVAIIGFTQIRDRMYKTKAGCVLSIIVFIITISTEAYTTNTFIWILIFYGMLSKNKYDMN